MEGKYLWQSKIFWTQIIGLAALLLTQSGYWPKDLTVDHMVEIIMGIVAVVTAFFRLGVQEPVALTRRGKEANVEELMLSAPNILPASVTAAKKTGNKPKSGRGG